MVVSERDFGKRSDDWRYPAANGAKPSDLSHQQRGGGTLDDKPKVRVLDARPRDRWSGHG